MSEDNFDSIMDEMGLVDKDGSFYAVTRVQLPPVTSNRPELVVNLPAKLMEATGWKEGDELVWQLTDILTEKYPGSDYIGATLCKKEDFDNEQTI